MFVEMVGAGVESNPSIIRCKQMQDLRPVQGRKTNNRCIPPAIVWRTNNSPNSGCWLKWLHTWIWDGFATAVLLLYLEVTCLPQGVHTRVRNIDCYQTHLGH